MSLSQLVAADLEQSLPRLLRGAAVVALVPATELRGWAAETAWQVARAAANGGRRTALVDCFVDAPTLHGVGGSNNEEGLVDAFEYGASLNRIVQQQPQANLFFISSGTFSTETEQLMQNPRWRRLSAGFRHEEALLLLYVSADHLAGLAADPDGLVLLAPQGMDVAVADAPALTEAIGRGMPVLAVVADEESVTRHSRELHAITVEEGPEEPVPVVPLAVPDRRVSEPVLMVPPPDRPSQSARARPSAPVMGMLLEAQRRRPNWLARGAGVVGLAALATMVWYAVTQTRVGAEAPVPTDSSRLAALAPPTVAPPANRVPVVESLPFAVQVASLPRLADALALADTLEAHETASFVSPIRLPGRRVLYRVHAGPYARAAIADSVLRILRVNSVIAGNAGARDSVPLSVALRGGLTHDGALSERTRLREAGVPTFILGQADGTFRLYAGAYGASAQATLLTDILTPTGGAGELVPRSGYVP